MLIVWQNLLLPEDQRLLLQIDSQVHYWPRSWSQVEIYNHAVPSDWYISFSQPRYGTHWLIIRPEYSRIVFSE